MNTNLRTCIQILLDIGLIILLFFILLDSTQGAAPPQPGPLPGSWNVYLPLTTKMDATQICNKAQIVADVTFPNGTLVTQNTSFSKIWRLKNVGTCTWSYGYSLVLANGNGMGAIYPVIMPEIVSPGQEVEIWVNFIAPQQPGTYTGYWMLRSPQGNTFGTGDGASQPLQVMVRVVSETINWQEYANNVHQISLMYPDNWRYISGDTLTGEYFAAEDGYFKVGALEGVGLTIDQVAQIEANQSSQPFGPNPIIEPVFIQGVLSRDFYEGRLVMASLGQRDLYPNAEMIVRFPTPRQINGKSFSYFVIYADVYHVQEIGFRLVFNSSTIFYPPDSADPQGITCNPVVGGIVTIPITTNTPATPCVKVTSGQRVKIVNQTGSMTRARLAWYNVALWAGDSVTLETNLGSFLAQGVHNLRFIDPQRYSPLIWLVN